MRIRCLVHAAALAASTLFVVFATPIAWAHCDTMDGPVIIEAQTALEKAQDAIGQIDALIGSPDGKAQPHPGFGQAVGLGVPGLKFVPGTDTADFNKRLELFLVK